MFYVIQCFTLLALAGLSSCSIARHGPVSVADARVNWSQSLPAGGQVRTLAAPVRVDHAYSVFNYKHANKAAQARYRTGNEGVPVSYPQPGLTRATNYKMPGLDGGPVGGVVVEHRLATGLAASNYKMPQSGRLLPTSSIQPGSRVGTSLETLNRRPSSPLSTTHSFTNKLD